MAPRIVILWKHDPGSFPLRCFQDQLNELTTALLQVRIRKDKTGNWGRVSIRNRIHWPQPLFQPTLPPPPPPLAVDRVLPPKLTFSVRHSEAMAVRVPTSQEL